MKLQEKYHELKNKRQALLATNYYNLETLQGVLRAASANENPIILQLTRSSIEYMGLPVAFNIARTMIDDFGVEAWIHLDHGDSYDLVARCLDQGFDSVMIDASENHLRKMYESLARWCNWPKNMGFVWRLNLAMLLN